MNPLHDTLADIDTFERACALALWHGDLNLAVEVLRRTMEHLSTAPGSADLGDSSPWQMNKKGVNSTLNLLNVLMVLLQSFWKKRTKRWRLRA